MVDLQEAELKGEYQGREGWDGWRGQKGGMGGRHGRYNHQWPDSILHTFLPPICLSLASVSTLAFLSVSGTQLASLSFCLSPLIS